MSYLYLVIPIAKVKMSRMSDVYNTDQPLLIKDHAIRLPAIWRPRGEREPIIIVGSYSGGAHCCYQYHCYRLGSKARKMEGPANIQSSLTFGDFRCNGSLECVGCDKTYDYWYACHAESPAPTIIEELKNGHWQLALDQMKVGDFAPKAVAKWLADCKSDIAEATAAKKLPDQCFVLAPSVWGVMLDFVYAGQANKAWKFLDGVWEDKAEAFLDDGSKDGKKMDKAAFKNALKLQIHLSPVFRGLALLNSGQDL